MKEKKKILIVDDDQDLVHMLKMQLNAYGYETHAAYEGVRAVQVAHQLHPDLILLDIRMPAGQGTVVIANLRKEFDTEKIPVIVMSGLSDDKTVREVLEAGAQDFLAKPLDKDKMLEKIEKYI